MRMAEGRLAGRIPERWRRPSRGLRGEYSSSIEVDVEETNVRHIVICASDLGEFPVFITTRSQADPRFSKLLIVVEFVDLCGR